MTNILKLPAFVYISNLLENYKRKQDELTKFKMKFLEREAYKNFYDQLLTQYTLQLQGTVDFHPSYYAKKEAQAKAREVVLQVAKNGRINHCYRARIEEIRKSLK